MKLNLTSKEIKRPVPLAPMSPFSSEVKKKNPIDKLFYWVVFKIAYHVGYIYYFVKGLILRK
tara:strand:- start:2816 stop:3001 length:186 start_codon:yes stop_codon:yes gene_type:complete